MSKLHIKLTSAGFVDVLMFADKWNKLFLPVFCGNIFTALKGSQFVFVIKFKVISRFCPGPKGHSPGYSADNFGTKRQTLKAL